MTTVALASEPATCSTCHQPAQCLVVTLADDPADMSRSAFTQRTMTGAFCKRCVAAAFMPRTFARSRWDEQGRPES